MVLAQEKPRIGRSRSKGGRMCSFRVDMILALCGLLVGLLTTGQVGDATVTRNHALANTDVLETSPAGLKQEVAIAKINSSASNLDGSRTKLKEFKAAIRLKPKARGEHKNLRVLRRLAAQG